jgi:hypothetical protein
MRSSTRVAASIWARILQIWFKFWDTASTCELPHPESNDTQRPSLPEPGDSTHTAAWKMDTTLTSDLNSMEDPPKTRRELKKDPRAKGQ